MDWAYVIGMLALGQSVDGTGRAERGGIGTKPLPGTFWRPIYEVVSGINFFAMLAGFVYGFWLRPWWSPLVCLGLHLVIVTLLPRAVPGGPWPPYFRAGAAKAMVGFLIAGIAFGVHFAS